MMKKTTFGAALAFLAVAAGALAGIALYLYRREKELDEYEKLLYSDDFEDYDDDEDYQVIHDDDDAEAGSDIGEDEIKF